MNTSKWILYTVIFGALLGTACEKLIEDQIKNVVEKAEKAANGKIDKTEVESEEEEDEDEGDIAVTNA